MVPGELLLFLCAVLPQLQCFCLSVVLLVCILFLSPFRPPARLGHQAYPMRANYYCGSGVLSSFLLAQAISLFMIGWNSWRLGSNALIYYGTLLLLLFTAFLVPWCMSAILKAVHTLEVQHGHLRMLRRLKFNKMHKDPKIIEKMDSLIELIQENDKPPKIFDTIPLNRITLL